MVKLFKSNGSKDSTGLKREKEVIAERIANLKDGESLRCKLGAKYGTGKDTAVISLNPNRGKALGEKGWYYQINIEESDDKTIPFGYNNRSKQRCSWRRLLLWVDLAVCCPSGLAW